MRLNRRRMPGCQRSAPQTHSQPGVLARRKLRTFPGGLFPTDVALADEQHRLANVKLHGATDNDALLQRHNYAATVPATAEFSRTDDIMYI